MKKLKNNRSGFTLVEIIVTFALTALFISSATLVLSTFLKSHAVASAVATEQDVASMIIETVSGELSAAGYVQNTDFRNADLDASAQFSARESILPPTVTDEEAKNCRLLIKNGSEVWYFSGASKNVVRMYLKDQFLTLEYYVKPKADAPEGTMWETTEWKLGEASYHGCSLDSFSVEQIKKEDGTPTSCLEVTLKLSNRLAGEGNTYTMRRSFDCYNLAADNILEGS